MSFILGVLEVEGESGGEGEREELCGIYMPRGGLRK